MLIAKQLKNNILQISLTSEPIRESYTCFEISEKEYSELLQYMTGFECKFEINTPLYNLWKSLCDKHYQARISKPTTIRKFKANDTGTSCLVRDVKDKYHVIKIARRKSNSYYINKVPISDSQRKLFFEQCKQSTRFKEDGTYGIDNRNEELYSKWYTRMLEIYDKHIQ